MREFYVTISIYILTQPHTNVVHIVCFQFHLVAYSFHSYVLWCLYRTYEEFCEASI